jgi:hypothetical protein
VTPLIIERRYCGPTGSGNGGYVCGRIAALAPGGVTVRLLRPVPLDTPLTVIRQDDRLELFDGDTPVAQARPGEIGALDPPAAPDRTAASEAARHYAGFAPHHPAPECFVCGPRRPQRDGLGIFPGAVGPESVVAAPWTPDASLDGGDGKVAPEFLWAALDCPGFHAVAPDVRPMLLGELTAAITRRVAIGEPCVVVGWRIGSEGRKHHAGTALFGADGALCGRARAIWIEPRPSAAA